MRRFLIYSKSFRRFRHGLRLALIRILSRLIGGYQRICYWLADDEALAGIPARNLSRRLTIWSKCYRHRDPYFGRTASSVAGIQLGWIVQWQLVTGITTEQNCKWQECDWATPGTQIDLIYHWTSSDAQFAQIITKRRSKCRHWQYLEGMPDTVRYCAYGNDWPDDWCENDAVVVVRTTSRSVEASTMQLNHWWTTSLLCIECHADQRRWCANMVLVALATESITLAVIDTALPIPIFGIAMECESKSQVTP